MHDLALAGAAAVAVALVLVVVLRALIVVKTRRLSRSTAGRVVGVVGQMGTGKSYAAVKMAAERLSLGVDVYSNFSMNVPDEWEGTWRPFSSWLQFASIRDAVVIIDEAHLYAPSYAHARFPQPARTALAFARKNGLDVYWISQHEDRVNRTLRDLTNEISVCTKRGNRFVLTTWPSEVVRRRGEHVMRQSYRFDPAIGDLYDTGEIIAPDEHVLK